MNGRITKQHTLMAPPLNPRRPNFTAPLDRLIYYLLAAILSVLDCAFCLCTPLRAAPSQDSASWADEDIPIDAKNMTRVAGSDNRLIRFSENTVAKTYIHWDDAFTESLSMDLVRKQTQIPVPRVRRTIPEGQIADIPKSLIVMDFVQNSRRLETVWPSLSLWRKLMIILTMRSYLRQLRHVRYPESDYRPGPPGTKPLQCEGYQFPNHGKALVYSTLEEFEYYFRNEYKRRNFRLPDSGPLPPYAFRSLVFTHNDLNMRNLLLDDRNILWMIDWGFSGFYPPWFEYLAMKLAAQNDDSPQSWLNCTKYMAECDFEIQEWMARVGYDFSDEHLCPKGGNYYVLSTKGY